VPSFPNESANHTFDISLSKIQSKSDNLKAKGKWWINFGEDIYISSFVISFSAWF